MNKHTPTPWGFEEEGHIRLEDQVDLLLEHVGLDAWGFVGVKSTDSDTPDSIDNVLAICHRSNAEHIVMCVNAHDELVEERDNAVLRAKYHDEMVAAVKAVLEPGITCISGHDDIWWGPQLDYLKRVLDKANTAEVKDMEVSE